MQHQQNEPTTDDDANAPSGAPQSAPHVSAGEAEAARGEGSGAPESADARAYAELHDRYLRLSADLQNLRKRMEREVEERSRRKSEGLLNGILGGLDELDRALAHLPDGRQGQDPLVQGVSLIREALIRAASQAGVREIPTVGTPFDPKIHEAIATIPTADAPPGHVVSEHRKGYLWGDRVLRPSQVVVAAAPNPTHPETNDPDARG
jgi:molecular chaperone GrpE